MSKNKFSSFNYDGKKADIFALGVVLFILYFGRPPFNETNNNCKYWLNKQKMPKTFLRFNASSRPAFLNGLIEPDLQDLLTKMLSTDLINERPC